MMYELQLATDTGFNNIVIDSTFNQIDTIESVSKLKIGTTYYWRVLANNGGHVSNYSPTRSFVTGASGVSETTGPNGLHLSIVPNPSSVTSSVRFHLSQNGTTTLTIENVTGQTVLTLLNGNFLSGGDYEISIPIGSLCAGTYLCRLESDDRTQVSKIVIE
jgi:hypothetical protein